MVVVEVDAKDSDALNCATQETDEQDWRSLMMNAKQKDVSSDATPQSIDQ